MTPLRDNALLPHSYDPGLVAISVLIAVLASYVALNFAARLTTTHGRERFRLLLGGALAMGTGIWSMHFVAMLAFSLPIPMFYDVPTVVLSHLAAVVAAGVALHVVSREAMGLKSWLLGSVLMGSGIGTMHYTGMLAIRLPGAMHHDPMMVALSVIIAVVVAMVALHLQFASKQSERVIKLRSALLMGLAIPGLHYTAMAGASFTDAGVLGDTSYAMNVSHLGSAVLILGTITILVLSSVLVIVSGNKRREALLRRHDLILNNALDCVITIDHEGRIVEFNPAAERTFCYPKANAVGKQMVELIVPPSLRAAHRRGFAHCLATGDGPLLGRRIEVTALRADGSEFPVELALTRIFLDGLPLFTAHLRDITDRRAAENSLHEARGRLDHLLASSPSIIYSSVATAVHRCTFVSGNLLETMGHAPEEMIADPEFWFAHLHPEDRGPVLAHFGQEGVHESGAIKVPIPACRWELPLVP